MTDEKRDKMLDKIRGLLAKAEGTNIEAEAQTFREAAQRLMDKYTIEAWQIQMASEGDQRTIQPERRDMSMSFYYDMSYDNPVRNPLWWMFAEVATHCRCKIVRVKADYSGRTIPVFGLPADLDYMDMLFTSLMIQMLQQVDPQPLERLSLEENLAMLREAGLGWEVVTERLIKKGFIEDPEPDLHFPRKRADWKWHCPERFRLSERLVSKYRKWCKENNRPQTYTNVKTYRRDFAAGFEQAISSRLWRMKSESQRAFAEEHDGNSMALAVRDIEQVVQAMVWDVFPDLAPHPADCECDSCHFVKCSDPECKRPRCVAARKPVRYRAAKPVHVDQAARAAGAEAGRRANISNPGSKRVGQTPELPR